MGSEVIVWNLAKGEEFLLKGHGDEVTCVDWDKSKLYSGSKDQHVIEWNVDTGVYTKKWKADKTGVQCICCHGDGSVLLTAGRAIKLWSLEDYTLIKRVSGHASSVNQLAFVSKESFLSSAGSDRVINYWQASSGGVATALTTLTCEEEVRLFHCTLDAEGAKVKVAVVSELGKLFLYEFSLSSLPPPPVTAECSLQYINSPHKPSTPSPLPVLAAMFPSSHTITVAHSSYIAPVLETIEFDQPDQHMCLVRDVHPSGLLLQPPLQQPSSVQPPHGVTVLGPGSRALQPDSLISDLRPLSDRLAPEARRARASLPSADSLTELLVQSVASGDGKLMEEVLRVSKERLITSTIKKLPVPTVLPFMKKLLELLQRSPSRGLQLSLWIKTLLSAHAAYLMTVPQLGASLGTLHHMLEARVSTFSRLCQLQGKLDLMIAQAALTTPPLPPCPVTEGADSDPEEDWRSDSDQQTSSADVSMASESSDEHESDEHESD